MSSIKIFEIRRSNLANVIDQLIESKKFKNGAAICAHYNLSASFISQLLNSHRQIGEKAARELEKQLGLVEGYLDQYETVEQSPELRSGISVFEMHSIDKEAFTLIDRGAHDLKQDTNFKPTEHQYLIRILGGHYFPSLHDGWYVLCNEQLVIQSLDYACVYLANNLQLILEFISENQGLCNFQSLDGKRRVSFQRSDIIKIHTVIAILSPHQVIASE